MAAATLITVAFGADESPSPGVTVTWLPQVTRGPSGATSQPPVTTSSTAEPQQTDLPATETPEPAPVIAGFAYPVVGGCLPTDDYLMPGASREYRSGTHEGVDFYDADNCAIVGVNTEVMAAKAGTVIRADWGYQDMTGDTLAYWMTIAEESHGTDQDAVDAFRGRQVWIDHGGGVVTRYCHLNGIAEGIDMGSQVEQGELIAYVGESGTPESVMTPGTEFHLHFEVRIGDSYLGAGMDADTIRALYLEAFSP